MSIKVASSSSYSGGAFPCRSHDQTAISQASDASVTRRQIPPVCRCGDLTIVRTVSHTINRGKKFWGCENYKDEHNIGCNFFLWYDDDTVEESDLKIAKQKWKICKLRKEGCLLKEEGFLLKQELKSTRKCLNISIVCGCVCFGINLVLVTMLCAGGRGNGPSTIYLK